MNKRAILVVSFGTSYPQTREKTIEMIEQEIRSSFPEYEVRRAFTSRMIIRRMKACEGISVDTEREALDRLYMEGYEEVIIQPTHIIHGFEYDKVVTVAGACKDKFKMLRMGRPLLSRQEDYSETAQILWNEAGSYEQENKGVIYMGHGSEHPANASYMRLEAELRQLGWQHAAIGTVEGIPDIKAVEMLAKTWDVDTLMLYPFMIVAGDHACQDMAGDDEDSWKMFLERKGYGVDCVLKGLGEYGAVREKFVRNVKEAVAL